MFALTTLAALALATLAMVERSLNRGAILQRLAQAATPTPMRNAATLRAYIRFPDVEHIDMIYPGAWGNMAQTIDDDINMSF